MSWGLGYNCDVGRKRWEEWFDEFIKGQVKENWSQVVWCNIMGDIVNWVYGEGLWVVYFIMEV